jgi:dUTP pyrophosphatase
LAVKGIDIGAGVCDSDYKGNYKVLVINNSNEDWTIEKGDRIAQLIFEVATIPNFIKVSDVGTSQRGCGGFGSSGA